MVTGFKPVGHADETIPKSNSGHRRRQNRYNLLSNMNRRRSILLALLLAGCSPARSGPPAFPEAAAGAWRLKGSRGFPASSAPEMVKNIGTRGWWSAVYEGPGSAAVEAYELTSSAGGLEMVQRWRPQADTVVFYTQRYFVVVKWQSPDRAAVTALVGALEQALEAGK